MGWFWADSPSNPRSSKAKQHRLSPSPSLSSQRTCPVDHSGFPQQQKQQQTCLHGRAVNPRNMMPQLPNHPSVHGLPTDREMSTIPMNEKGELWEYPSPQQMLNAMNRKGYDTENPEDVPAMVAVHNFVNEGSWAQVLKWERKYFPENVKPHLVEFRGRPAKPTPKSYFLYWTGQAPQAFDHHEWFVSTGTPGRFRRYVIDYYGLDDLTFSVDARPAVDDFASLLARTTNVFDSLRGRVTGVSKEDDKITRFESVE